MTVTEKINKYLYEAKTDYTVYHNSYTSAIMEAERWIERQGYTLDDEEVASKIGSGPSKPSKGKTNRFSLSIFKNGKKQKKMFHIQIYNRGIKSMEYELNMYIL